MAERGKSNLWVLAASGLAGGAFGKVLLASLIGTSRTSSRIGRVCLAASVAKLA